MLISYVLYDLELTQGPGGLEISLVTLWHLGGCITSSEAGPAAINLRISSQNGGAEPDFRWVFFFGHKLFPQRNGTLGKPWSDVALGGGVKIPSYSL